MPRTNLADLAAVRPFRELPAAALRAVVREGYGVAEFKKDLLAGTVVGVVALPLSMALAIAVGVSPQHGLYTAIIAGFLVAALGGSRTQVTGPTAAFVVILAPIGAKFGLSGLLVAGVMAGCILIALALMRMGKLIEFIPHPVTTGFTAGIATVIAVLQIKDLFGLTLTGSPEHFIERIGAMAAAWRSTSIAELAIGAFTLAVLIAMPLRTRRIPAALVALPLAAIGTGLLNHFWPGLGIDTVSSRFHTQVDGQMVAGIPRLPPMPLLPWHVGGGTSLGFASLRELLPGAFAIAMLGAIESLLSAVVADGMAQTVHDPDAELFALGIGNVVCPFFGGIAATGAIARTATNIRSGARSPVAAMVHSVVILISVIAIAPLIGYLPMSGLAALLILVAWNMSDTKHFFHILRVAPRSDKAVLLVCFGLTVVFDMVIAVTTGVMLAALMFMKRMAVLTNARVSEGESVQAEQGLPRTIVVYDISGPLFFGAAQRAMAALALVSRQARVVIFRMENVPMIDATGLVAFESALATLKKQGIFAYLTGLQPQPSEILIDAGVLADPACVVAVSDFATAKGLALERIESEPVPLHKRPTSGTVPVQ